MIMALVLTLTSAMILCLSFQFCCCLKTMMMVAVITQHEDY